MNCLDLFSGVGGFSLGIERSGIKIDQHFNSDIDVHANAVYKFNFKNSKYVGSVTDVSAKQLPKIDIITFGSPCQDFSLAGKRSGMGGKRSSLITEAIRLIRECRPSVFVWENVKGTFSSNNGEDFWAIIKEFTNIGGYRLEWQLLNTKWFLPQNRERIYLIGHLAEGNTKEVFPIGKDDKLFTREIRNKTRKSTSEQTRHTRAISSRIHKMGSDDTYIKVVDKRGNVKEQNHASTIVAGYHKHPSDGDYVIGSMRGRNPDNPSDRRKGIDLEQRLEVNTEGVSNTLTSVQKDNYVIGDYRNDEGYRERKDGDSPCLATRKHSETDISTMPPIVNKIRRLTPLECERLQGFPDNWTKYGDFDGEIKEISDTQRYKQCGNAVTVDVVKEIFSKLYR